MTQFHRHRTGIIRKRNPTPKLNEDEPEVRKRKVSRLRHLAAEAATRLNLTASIALESILTVCVDVFEQWTLPLGQVQLLSCYDSRAHILYVTILRARKLQTRRPNGDARPDPLVRCILLPGRQAENERRTRFLSLTSDPEWHQTMVYPAVTPAELHKRQLEVTVWHHQYDGTLEFLGEFLLDLTSNPLNLRLSPTIFP